MAIYHLAAKIGTKEKGHSAGQKCAYVTRTENFIKKADECAYSASGNMPKWPKVNPQNDAAHYWKAADTYERDNGRLFRELEFALPRELTLDQQKALCHAFADKVSTLDKGEKVPFTFAIHTDKDNHNPHCHLMISERVNDGIARNASTWFKRANPKDPKKGGAVKTQELNGKQWLNPTREMWAVMANDALQKAGIAATIDHRSHKDRKLDALPSVHLGRTCAEMIRRGAWCHRGPQIMRQNTDARLSQRLVKLTRLVKQKIRTTYSTDSAQLAEQISEDVQRAMQMGQKALEIEAETARQLAETAKKKQRSTYALDDAAQRIKSRITPNPYAIPKKPKPPGFR